MSNINFVVGKVSNEEKVAMTNFVKTYFTRTSVEKSYEKIAFGATGEIFKVSDTVIAKVNFFGDSLVAEKEKLQKIKSAFVPSYKGFAEMGKQQVLFMEFVEGDTLLSAIINKKYDLNSDVIIEKIYAVYQDLINHGVYPKDMHLNNIMINAEGQIKFIDVEQYIIVKDPVLAKGKIKIEYPKFLQVSEGAYNLFDKISIDNFIHKLSVLSPVAS